MLGLSARAAQSATGVPAVHPLTFLRHPLSHLPRRLPPGLPTPVRPVPPRPVGPPPTTATRPSRTSGVVTVRAPGEAPPG